MDTISQKIIDHSIEYARNLLEDTGQCYPFGAFIDKAGQVHPLEFEITDKKNIPNNESVMWSLRKYCETELDSNNILAFGLTYEASVLLQRDQPEIETIAVDITNPQDDELPIFYYPYTKNESGLINFGDTFAVAR